MVVCQAGGATVGEPEPGDHGGAAERVDNHDRTEAVSAEVASVSSVNVADSPNVPSGGFRVLVLGRWWQGIAAEMRRSV
eukprot:224667-Hanusia_phi.AAC.1